MPSLDMPENPMTVRVAGALVSVCALALLANATPVSAASLSRSTNVKGTPTQVWATIGPFCAIKDWHPAIGACTEDGKTPPTRTLVTKDGNATFVELQTTRSDSKHRYANTFTSSPLPVTHYTSKFEVVAKSKGFSTVTWSSTYAPNPGKEEDAKNALIGIYESGLEAIKTKLAK